MKKLWIILLATLLFVPLSLNAQAAGSASLSASAQSAKVGNNITFTLSLSRTESATSASVQMSYNAGVFDYVSHAFAKSGAMLTNYDAANKAGALAFQTATDFNGAFFTITLRVKASSASAQSVGATVQIKNGGTVSTSCTVKAECASHTFGAWSQTKAPTCTAAGQEQRTCSACGAKETRAIAALGHSYGSWMRTKNPNCTEKGTETRTCTRDASHVETREVAATGHSFGAWTQVKAPTCTAAGQEQRTCSVCQAKETRNINALGHAFSSPTVTKQPTCTEAGIQSGTCSRCHQTTTQAVPALGHSWGAWKVTKDADCETEGMKTRTCTRDASHTESRTVAPAGHDFEDPQVVKEATLTETGLMQGKCRRCGKTTDQTIPCQAQDAATGIAVSAEEGTFEAGAELKVEKVENTAEPFEKIKQALHTISEKFAVFDVSVILNGAPVQPKKAIKVAFPIPEGFGKKVAVYFIADNGETEEIESEVSENGKTVTATLEHLSLYTVVDLTAKGSSQPDEPETTETEMTVITPDKMSESTEAKENSSNTVLIIIIAVVVVAAAAGGVFFFLKKRKQ